MNVQPSSSRMRSDCGPSQRSTYIKLLILWTMWSLLYAWHGSYLGINLLRGMLVVAIVSIGILRKALIRSPWQVMLAIYVPIVSLSWSTLIINGPHWPLWLSMPLAPAAVLVAFGGHPRVRALGWALVGGFGVLSILSAWHWGSVNIDVFSIGQQGALDFLRGVNPYQSWFRSTTIGVARFRYDYGPLWLPLTAPFARLGDARLLILLSSVSIVALGAWRYGWRRYSTWMWLMLLLLSPWLVWGTIMFWTELTMMALLLGWYATRQQWRWSWLFLAVALGANPIIGVLLLPVFAVMPEVRAQIVYAGLAAAVCWVCAWGLSGADLIQAFKIADRQGYNPTIGLGGFYLLLTHHALPKIASLVVAMAEAGWLWRHQTASVWQRELLAGVGCLLIVWSMPAGYFEYALIPALWLWWTLGRATSLVVEPIAEASAS